MLVWQSCWPSSAAARTATRTFPFSVRYDPHEKTHGQPLPHLFARRVSTRHEVISLFAVRNLLNATADWAGLTDNGSPCGSPHTTSAACSPPNSSAPGLPLHIAASLLGHLSLDTTRGYTAVFPEHLIAAHEALIERRRKQRQDAELRSASGEQWAEFEQHFLLRKVALGDCHRPYGTPLRPRTRLHPMPLPPRRPRPTRTTRADDHQRRSPTGRSPRPRLARRSRRPRRQPDPPATTAHRGRSPTPSLDRGVQLSQPSSLGSKV